MRLLQILLCCALLTGCSAAMALSGKKEPQLTSLRVGATRGEVEINMGPPVEVRQLEGKPLAIYAYEEGNEAAPGRAIGHAVLDVFTLGVWEVLGTPIEGIQGKKKYVSVVYDESGKVEKLGTIAPTSTPRNSSSRKKQEE